MLSPKRTANMNSGTKLTMGTSPLTPSSELPQPF